MGDERSGIPEKHTKVVGYKVVEATVPEHHR